MLIEHVLPTIQNPQVRNSAAGDFPWWSLGFPGSSVGKEPACNVLDPGSIPGLGRYPGEGNGNSSILDWKILWTEEPGELPFMGSQESDTT